MNLVDTRTGTVLEKLMEHHIHTIELWMRKLDWDAERRTAYWLDVASESQVDEIPWEKGLFKRPPMPVTVTPETGEGISWQPGVVRWARPYRIDWDTNTFPFDFPLNGAQIHEFRKAGYRLSVLPDGTGFTYQSDHTEEWGTDASKQGLLRLLSEHFHFDPKLGKGEKNEQPGFRTEDVGAGGFDGPGCGT